ncbi:MAG: DNA recombination protein RmuC [Candidatus Omnitrophota bacterium]
MPTPIFFITLFTFLVLIVILVLRLTKQREDTLLHQKIDSLREEFTKHMIAAQGNLLENSRAVSQELHKLYEKVGSLDRESSEILILTKSFHDILKPTKTRGIVGEAILDNLIKDVLPQDVIASQYAFKNGKKIDFAIKMASGIIPIDAKFSLDTFRNYLDATEGEKERQKKVFVDSVKKRIDETAAYIFTEEGTTDFSLMYVPSEAVYYFIIVETALLDYAQKKRVFVVGPNTIYVYLKTICIGFQALKIEAKAKEIYNSVRQLDEEIRTVLQEYVVLGTHLRNASVKYDEVRKKIESVSVRVGSIGKQD